MRDLSDRFHHLRVRMRVLVSVEMGRLNSGSPYSLNLRPQFPLDFFRGYPSRAQSRHESDKRRGKSTLSIQERRNFLAWRNRCPANQDEMASDSQFRIRPCPLDRIIKRRAIRHQRCTRENSVSMSQNNSLVYAVCQTKVICIENQLFHFQRNALGQKRMISRANLEQDLKSGQEARMRGRMRQGNFHAR